MMSREIAALNKILDEVNKLEAIVASGSDDVTYGEFINPPSNSVFNSFG